LLLLFLILHSIPPTGVSLDHTCTTALNHGLLALPLLLATHSVLIGKVSLKAILLRLVELSVLMSGKDISRLEVSLTWSLVGTDAFLNPLLGN
jgi:hypothetical protein